MPTQHVVIAVLKERDPGTYFFKFSYFLKLHLDLFQYNICLKWFQILFLNVKYSILKTWNIVTNLIITPPLSRKVECEWRQWRILNIHQKYPLRYWNLLLYYPRKAEKGKEKTTESPKLVAQKCHAKVAEKCAKIVAANSGKSFWNSLSLDENSTEKVWTVTKGYRVMSCSGNSCSLHR